MTTSNKTPGVSRQREGWRLSPGRPERQQHANRAAQRPTERHRGQQSGTEASSGQQSGRNVPRGTMANIKSYPQQTNPNREFVIVNREFVIVRSDQRARFF